MKKILSLSTITAIVAFGAGYKVPEQSLRSVGLAGAYVAGANSAEEDLAIQTLLALLVLVGIIVSLESAI